VYLPESVKDLTWAHEGRCYRSQIVIRLCGRRRTEAYLHTLDDAGGWQPVRLDDGMVSDGRVETYTRCVEAICGSAETFFTSVFAAQGKRQLSTYRNAEIKSLLADLLGQEEIQALGQKAAETVRLLKAGLATIRQELIGLDAEGVRLEATRRQLDGAGERVSAAERAKTAAHAALEGSAGVACARGGRARAGAGDRGSPRTARGRTPVHPRHNRAGSPCSSVPGSSRAATAGAA
jgi:exonuclease SbcC